tara:strand:+ start:11179 stop:12042 length:864 start_codon:yes stop_codon:yes gene_type:complete
MQDKHVAITGPTAGIGRATSLELARQGAQLTLFCRNADKANALCDEIATVADHVPRVILMDMADLGSVRRAAQTFLETAPPLDVLLNNAGVINTTRRETVDGFEETLAVNHFAPFLLTGLLMPAIQHGGNVRIVNVASAAHEFVRGMDFDDMHAQKSYSTFRVYGRSKLANILFTRSLAQRLEDTPITVNCLHPGAVSTSLGTHNKGLASSLLPLLLKPFFRTPEQGAATSLYLCTSDEVADISGEYFANCKLKRAKPWARDDAAAERLWQFTEESLDFRFPLSAGA